MPGATRSVPTRHHPFKQPLKAVLIFLVIGLSILSAPTRAVCMLSVVDIHPLPLPEPCDDVLTAHEHVYINVTSFDVALSSSLLALPGLALLIWLALPEHRVFPRLLALVPESPPPRPIALRRL
jgi:hypothetical protein